MPLMFLFTDCITNFLDLAGWRSDVALNSVAAQWGGACYSLTMSTPLFAGLHAFVSSFLSALGAPLVLPVPCECSMSGAPSAGLLLSFRRRRML